MQFKKESINVITLLKKTLTVLVLTGLSAGYSYATDKTIRLGTISGQDAQIWAVAQKVAKQNGFDIKIIEFNDYIQPNAALNAGDIDANSFQHTPYLQSQVKQRKYQLVSVGQTYIAPVGIYSRKFKTLKDLPQGARIGVPNDPSNENRALLLLEKESLIKLKPQSKGKNATLLDIAENPKKIRITELDAAQLPRSLPDLDFAVINTNYAMNANLNPMHDALAIESRDSPYTNIIVVREKDKNAPWVKNLVAAYQSKEVKQFIEKEFKGGVLPAF